MSCESVPDGIDWNHPFVPEPTPLAEYWNNWSYIVHSFTNAELTYSNDKAVAISGVARRFADIHGAQIGQYLAGLWGKTLVRDLCWQTWGKPPQRTVPSKGEVFPTWSWLSVGAASIMMHRIDSNILYEYVKVADIRLIYATNDPFGNIREGTLELDTKFLHGAFLQKSLHEVKGYELCVQSDAPGVIIWPQTIHLDEEFEDLTTFTLVPAANFEVVGGHDLPHALLLRRLISTKGRYRRVGCVTFDSDYWKHEMKCFEQTKGEIC